MPMALSNKPQNSGLLRSSGSAHGRSSPFCVGVALGPWPPPMSSSAQPGRHPFHHQVVWVPPPLSQCNSTNSARSEPLILFCAAAWSARWGHVDSQHGSHDTWMHNFRTSYSTLIAQCSHISIHYCCSQCMPVFCNSELSLTTPNPCRSVRFGCSPLPGTASGWPDLRSTQCVASRIAPVAAQ
jgi:hypothetical protein